MENLLPPFIRITPDAYVGSEASSIARFLCLGGFWRWLSSRRAGGGVPTRSRARRFASFQPRNCSFAGGLVGLIGRTHSSRLAYSPAGPYDARVDRLGGSVSESNRPIHRR